MMPEFRPVHTVTYNCLEDVLECIATGFKREHLLIYADAWDFNFFARAIDSHKIIGNRIEAGEYNAWDNLSGYHGIKSKCHFTSKRDKQFEILKTILKTGEPVVLWLDGYYVPWTNVFEKLHMKHFIIAIGIDEDEKMISAIDPYWNKKINKLPYKYFDLSEAKCIGFSLLEVPEIDWKKIVYSRAKIVLDREYSAFDAMKAFAKEVGSSIKMEDEIKGFEKLQYNCPLFMQLAEVFYRRLNYSKMLIALAENIGNIELLNLGIKMKKAGERWRAARELLVKVMEGKETADKIFVFEKEVISLADFEENIATKLILISQ